MLAAVVPYGSQPVALKQQDHRNLENQGEAPQACEGV
jgi:hypothetical protein